MGEKKEKETFTQRSACPELLSECCQDQPLWKQIERECRAGQREELLVCSLDRGPSQLGDAGLTLALL